MRFHYRKKITSFRLVFAILFALFSMSFAQEIKPSSGIAQKELQKRRASVQEGQMLMQKGDEAYLAGNFKDAVEAFGGASSVFPDTPTTAELRNAALERYAQASIEYSKFLVRQGRVEEAKAVIDVVLAETVAPNHAGAIAARNELDDPIRTNPALTREQAKNVDQVRRLLYMGHGAYDLGKFDEAKQHFTEILKIDPYNHAARRGLERVTNQKSKYYRSAYDQTRAEALMEVERAWELPLPPYLVIPPAPAVTEYSEPSLHVPLSNKLSRIIIPKFIVEEVTLLEALDVLRVEAKKNDFFELDPELKGVNITVNLGDHTDSSTQAILAKKFDLRVSNVPVETILKYITEMTKTHFRYDDYAVTVSHRGAGGGSLISRTYRVPPDFMTVLTAGVTEAAAEEVDIFNATPDFGGMLAKRMGVKEVLAQKGISFPEGASASLNPASNMLLVINTLSNHDIIQQIIDSIFQTEPVIVTVRVTMIKVEQNILEELGFDWMLNDFGLGGGSGSGSSGGFLSGGTVGSGSIIDDFPLVTGVPAALNPITAGNRSGDGAFTRFNLDQLLAEGTNRQVQRNERAPGVVGVNGVINNTTIQMLMRGLDQKKGSDVLATPSVTTRSGQAASVTMVREFIYPSEYSPPELPQSIFANAAIPIIPSVPEIFETRNTGIFLEVLPTADANRQYIDVSLKPTMTDLDGFVNFGSPINFIANGQSIPLAQNQILMPVFSVKRLETSMVVADGATIVIGGLLKESVTTVNDKTPILGDIPVVGRLFQSEGVKRNSTALIFFVNVELVDPTGRPYRDR